MKEAVVLYTCPLPGHLASTVELAKKLVLASQSNSLSVIILLNSMSLESVTTTPNISATTLPSSITFHHLPLVYLPQPSSSIEFTQVLVELSRLQNPNFQTTLNTLSQTIVIKAVVLDIFCDPAFDVSSSILNIPTYYYYTGGASSLANLLYIPTLHETITTNIEDLNDYIYFPATPPIHFLDVPEGLNKRNTETYKNIFGLACNLRKCAGLLSNTFEAFEPRAIKAIVDGVCIPNGTTPPLYCIGPLVANHDRTQSNPNGRHECLRWLDLQPRQSVVFLCFGSMGLFGMQQLREMAIGLEKSGYRFLWVVRFSEKEESLDLDSLMPQGFLERTKRKGLVIDSWVPQADILSHDSVGGFVTHCGWNSTLESIMSGVPMLGWPLYAEQRSNRVYMVEEMKVALGIKESNKERFVSSDELEKGITELMEGEGGKTVREKVFQMRDAAKLAIQGSGSSTLALAKFLQSL